VPPTRFVLLRPLKGKTSKEIAEVLYGLVGDFGVPKILQYDQDPSFVAEVVEEFRKVAGFERRVILPYNPRQNGPVERMILEIKHLLLKRIRGDLRSWVFYIPAIQMGLNQRIVGRYRSSPFALFFARVINKFEDYSEVEIVKVSEEELQKRGDEMVRVVYPEIEKISREVGEKECSQKKRVGERKESLEVGTRVMKRVDVRGSKSEERFEGIYTVVAFDKRSGGYSLLDDVGALMRNKVPLDKLQVVQVPVREEEGEMFEVERVWKHRGEEGSREYLVEWKGWEQKQWVKQEDFGSKECVRQYWEEVKGSQRVRGRGRGRGRG